MNTPVFSYAPQVQADDTGTWAGNALRFATEQEATDNVRELSFNWLSVRKTRVIESYDPVTHKWVDGKLEAVT